MEVSRGSVFRPEARANAKALKQGTTLACLRISETYAVLPKGLIKEKSRRKQMTAVTERWIERGLQASVKRI